jgi:hypothetical protein
VWQKGLLLLQKGPRGHVGVPDPVIVSLRIGDEPQPPRDWPTAIVTKWSGKR